MTALWYVARRGQDGNKRYGPVPLHELQELMDSGRVRGDDLVWHDGMASWQRADQCSALNPQPAPPPEPRGYPTYDRQGDGYGYDRGSPAYGPYDDRPYRRPYYRPQSSSAWVIPVVVVGCVLAFGALAFGGLMLVAYTNSRSSAASGYSTPAYYNNPTFTQPVEEDPGPDQGPWAPGAGAWAPPGDPPNNVIPDPPAPPNPFFLPPDDNQKQP